MCHRACSLVGRVVIRSPTAGEVVNFRSIETEVCRLLATIARSGTLESPRNFGRRFRRRQSQRDCFASCCSCFVAAIWLDPEPSREKTWHSAKYAIQMVRIAADSMTTVFVKLTSLSANRYRTRILPIKRNYSRCAKPPFRIRGIAIDASGEKISN